MPEQIYIGNFSKGLTTSRLPFVIDNYAFPFLQNFYIWRGRAKRKRGTIFLGRLQVQVQSVLNATPPAVYQKGQLALVAGSANLISGFSLIAGSTIVPGSIHFTVSGQTWTEHSPPNGTLIGSGGGTGTINYASGAVTFSVGGTGPLIGTFSYYPDLPVLGLEDFVPSNTSMLYPILLGFDTDYSYQINQSSASVFFYNVNYYKGTNVPFIWSGTDFQQFWTTNYSNALWATNGKAGLNLLQATYTSGSGTNTQVYNFTLASVPFTTLVIGDKVWFNEFANSTIDGQTGTVSVNSGGGTYTITFTTSPTSAGTGIVQLLTNTVPGQDGIKWYDGDPTGGTGIPTGTGLGWVNFAPPLTATTVPIDNHPTGLYYLVGALGILPYKDRLLFFSPIIQTSTGVPITLQDTVLWSWNGTPYYAQPVPINQTSNPIAYYVDQTGAGGYLPAGISQPIITVSNNEDVLLIGFGGDGRKTRFVYTGNDFQPFLFYNINSELPSSATFSSVALDKGAIDIGVYGIAMTDQQSSARIDLDIPDSVFQIQALNNGMQRVNAVRDFYKEWIYFAYPVNNSPWKFPTQTFLYNYRDNTWGMQYENFTAHGSYRATKKKSWLTTGFASWNVWREAWNSGAGSPQFPSIIAGNPQGYVLIKGQGTGEAPSGDIQAIVNSGGNIEITSINHCVDVNDYLLITGMLGATAINDLIGKVISTADANTFVIDLPFPAGTYLGLGLYTRLSQPLIQTKQFPVYWDQGRQTRLSTQKYLMDFTANSQVTVNVYLSQDPDDVWNGASNPSPNSLVYSQIMYTCPESSNIGLTPANTNLQMPTAAGQYQIWHRFNTSLIGDSVQVGITLSDAQMRNLTYATSEITLQGMHLTVEKGPHLA